MPLAVLSTMTLVPASFGILCSKPSIVVFASGQNGISVQLACWNVAERPASLFSADSTNKRLFNGSPIAKRLPRLLESFIGRSSSGSRRYIISVLLNNSPAISRLCAIVRQFCPSNRNALCASHAWQKVLLPSCLLLRITMRTGRLSAICLYMACSMRSCGALSFRLTILPFLLLIFRNRSAYPAKS